MSETKLKPCPFCGGKADKRIEFPCDGDGLEMNMYIVGCKDCGIEFSWLWDEDCVIEIWNTRKPMDDIVQKLEYAKEMPLTDCGMSYNRAIDLAINLVKEGGTDG